MAMVEELMPPLGAFARVEDAFAQTPARFRLEFAHDRRARELRWALFAGARRGAVGKLIFTLERDGAAHIKSIAVNAEWRGLGLARVLCLACLSTLRELAVSELRLEAEEDTKRHGKLVALYESWGFHQKEGEKVLFLYNDTQCFRKVPMALSCGAGGAFQPVQPSAADAQWFCMLTLQTADGTCLVAAEDGAIEARREKRHPASLWQTLLGERGEIFLRSAHGKFLCVEAGGNILADRPLNSTWETFQVVPHRSDADADTNAAAGVALRDFHGNYLCIDQEKQAVVSSRVPVPWDGGDMMALVCNKGDSTAAPLFARVMRKLQTRAFVAQQVAKYAAFQHAALSVADACSVLARLNGDADARDSWVIKYMLATAEAAREDGHPDWLQLAVFMRALGMLFLCWTDEDNAALRSVSAREWLTKNATWIVGEPIPDSVGFPELNALNSDHNECGKSAAGGARGIDGVTLPWTPDEYLFRMLEFNKASVPTEALQAVRFWSLRAWYEHDCYDELCAPQDTDTKEWLQAVEMYASVSEEALKRVQPDALMPHYLALADKYLPAVLQW